MVALRSFLLAETNEDDNKSFEKEQKISSLVSDRKERCHVLLSTSKLPTVKKSTSKIVITLP
jgi:hypothetical protein